MQSKHSVDLNTMLHIIPPAVLICSMVSLYPADLTANCVASIGHGSLWPDSQTVGYKNVSPVMWPEMCSALLFPCTLILSGLYFWCLPNTLKNQEVESD